MSHRSVVSCLPKIFIANIRSISDLSRRELSIACLNINSLILDLHLDSRESSANYAHSLGWNIDVLLATNETKLDSSITDNSIYFHSSTRLLIKLMEKILN